jgi:transcriptional regulator with XRE-family HTH domain
VESENVIGTVLRARRELVQPSSVGLSDTGDRRVPGLRREELSLLAGISTDYYMRLEQGRDQHPSPQVLDALARALQLDDDATAHLHELSRPARHRPAPAPPERITPGLGNLIASWVTTPAYVADHLGNVLAANPLATALSPMYTPGVNYLREAFLDHAVRALYRYDWDRITETSVAALRALVGTDVDDRRLIELVGELSLRSERFRQLWARYDVQAHALGGAVRLEHPQVGPMELQYEKLAVTGTRQTLVIYHAEPTSPSGQALALLATLAAEHPASAQGSGGSKATAFRRP